jgi:tRNA G10  N-methylase Trm11
MAQNLKREMIFRGLIDRKQNIFIKRQRNHDLLFFNRLKNEERLALLRMSETIMRCPLFGRFKISKNQLSIMASELKALSGPRRLVIQVAGRVFDRRDLSRWLTREMNERGVSFSENEDDPEVWMICIDEAYYFGIPAFKEDQAAGRSARTQERPGSLPPPIAAAIAFAGMPADDDVIFDPTCGSGTLLAEAHAYAPRARLIGRDIDPEAIAIAKQNLSEIREQGVTVDLKVGDSRLPLTHETAVTLAMANLPFGVQFGSKADNPKLYEKILGALLSCAHKDKWRAVLYTSDVESLEIAIKQLPQIKTQNLFHAKARGENATAFLVKRTEGR